MSMELNKESVEQAGGDERAAFDAYRDRRNALLESEGHKPGSKWHVTNAHYPTWEASRAALAQPSQKCATCNGTGLIDDGEITCSEGGIPYENGPVKCVKDCPDCKAQPSPAPELERPEGVAYLFVKPDGSLSMDAVRHKPKQPAVAVMAVDEHAASVARWAEMFNRAIEGHGHVFPRADGVKMRCGGPGLCPKCTADASLVHPCPAHPAVGQAARDERKLSDLGNELHNLSCSIIHENEEWAAQIGGIARELWNWPQARAALAEVAGLRSLLNSLLCYVERDINRMRSDRDKSDNKEIYDRSISLAMERLKAAQNAVFTTEPGCDTAVELAAQTTQAQHSVPGDIMRDAQRYRWLRDQQFYFSFSTENSDAGISSCTAGMSSRFKNLSWVDAAIDSAIAAAPGKEGV
ncbi:TPA: hypothetical protein NIC04_001298 [Pseudomonas aeruginosa]|nr:hypothetical protein [Pseudomonas aeruginosa]